GLLDAVDCVRGHRHAWAVSRAAARDEMASGKGTARDSDLELASGKALRRRQRARLFGPTGCEVTVRKSVAREPTNDSICFASLFSISMFFHAISATATKNNSQSSN